MTKLDLTCTRIFKCDAKTVWNGIEDGTLFHFTEPKDDSLTMDFREGGKYCIAWPDHPDGVEGQFLQIVPHKKIVFSWNEVRSGNGYKTTVSIDLLEKAGATLLTLHHEGFETYARVEDHTKGWDSTLKDFMNSLRPVFAKIAKEKSSPDLYFRHRQIIKAPLDKVFDAVRDGKTLAQYFPVNREDSFETDQTVRWAFRGYPEFELHVHAVIENQLIKFKWDDMHVCFTFRDRENQQTEVTLEFTSSKNDQAGLDDFTSECEGWGNFLVRLKFFFERGFKNEDFR